MTARILQSDVSVKVGTLANVGRSASKLANALRRTGEGNEEWCQRLPSALSGMRRVYLRSGSHSRSVWGAVRRQGGLTMGNASDAVSGSDADVKEWVRSFRLPESGSTEFPPHHSNCLGCGPANPHGHHLSVLRCGDGVVAHHTFDERHVGAPGIAHGGAVATVIDDLFGFLLYSVGELAVTRRLELDYLAPVLLFTPYTLHADVRSRDGRKFSLVARMFDAEGRSVAKGTALFIVVEVEHFLQSQANAWSQS